MGRMTMHGVARPAADEIAAVPFAVQAPLPGPTFHFIGRNLALLGIFITALAAVYSSALILHYGMNDDYGLLDQAVWHKPRMPAHPEQISASLSAQGRPLFGWMVRIAFVHARTLANLRYLRMLSLFGLALTAWALHWMLRRAGWKPITAIGLAICFCTLPPAQVFATWATFFPGPFAMLEAVLAGLLASWMLNGSPRRVWLTPLAAVLLILSFMTYQPAGMVFVALTLIDGFAPLRRQTPFKEKLLRMAFFQGINAVGLIGGFLAFRIGLRVYPAYAIPGRTGFAASLADKPAWFFEFPLTDAMNLWLLSATGWIACIGAVLLLIGLSLYFTGAWQRVLCIVICALALPVAHLPNLLSERSDAYRTQIGLSWVVMTLAVMAAAGIWRALGRIATALRRQNWRGNAVVDPFPRGLVLVITALAMGAAAYTSTVYITWPRALELAILRQEMTRPDVQAAHHLIFLLLRDYNDTPAPAIISDEFGCPTLANRAPGPAWAQQGAVYLIDLETNPRARRRDIETVMLMSGPYTKPLPPDTALVDLRNLDATR